MFELKFGRLDARESLKDQVLTILRQTIVSGEIRPGEMYSTSAIARQLGISLSPAREAMLTLVQEGILEPVKNRGFKVVSVSEDDLREIVNLRILLEIPAIVELCRFDITHRENEFRKLAAKIEMAAGEGDVVMFLHYDRIFHLSLLELAGNRRLIDYVARLRDQTRLYGLHALAHSAALEGSAYEHVLILQAILDKDEARVRRLMHSHLKHIQSDWSTGESHQSSTLSRGIA